ncbi:MAG: cytochrome c [Bdellovibrionaceae bacterium]|nr:cytochrome c [Pseudobdellovibrionaceae bacterium]
MSENQDQFNRGGFYAFIFSMTFVFAFMFYLVAIHPGVNLDEKVVDPHDQQGPAVEQFDIQKVAEPWVPNDEVAAYGKKLFQINCAMCHGNEGKGDGPAGAGLNPKPRNLVEGKWTHGSGLVSHYKVLSEGIPGTSMASYAHFKPADRWALAQFIESITENKGSDDPAKVAEFAKTAK